MVVPLPSPRRAPRTRRDDAVSEVLGTVLLTAMTIVLAGGFAIAVFGSFTGSDTPSPTGAFAVEARGGLPYVNVTFREGTSFPTDAATFALLLDGAPLSAHAIPNQLAAGRFSPGDVMRFPVAGGVSPGANLTFFAVDADTGDVIGRAFASVPASGSLPSFSASSVVASAVSFSPATLTADGANVTTIRVSLAASHGVALTKSVIADLSSVGGGSLLLRDDGTGGDAVANDGVFSGQFSASSGALPAGAAGGSATIPVTVTDILGRATSGGSGTLSLAAAATATSADFAAALANATSATNVLGVGGISRNVPNSTALKSLVVTNFTWRDITAIRNDVILYRITDLADTTKSWAAAIYFSDCAIGNGGGPYGAITEIVFTRDGVPGSAQWRPTSPTDCWAVDYDTRLDLANLNLSVNATGESPSWTARSQTISGSILTTNPQTYSFVNAGIGSINQGIVPYFGDTQPTANPHGSVDDLGLSTAQIEWTRHTMPNAVFTWARAGLTVAVDARAGDPQGVPVESYTWTWGDGTTTTGVTSSHTYAANATDTVTLAVRSVFGSVATANATILHDGNSWLSCPPAATAWGDVTSCAAAQNSTDSQAAMRLTETHSGGARHLLVTFTMGAFPEPSRAHTLQARAGLASGTAEALALQVLDPTSGVWTTHATWSGAMTTSTATPLTNAQWNAGQPTFRFVDANCVTGACAGSDSATTAWDIDWVRVVSS